MLSLVHKLKWNMYICTCIYCCCFSGILGDGRDGEGEGDDRYDNPEQDLGDQYSPPDGPLNAPVDPGEHQWYCTLVVMDIL